MQITNPGEYRCDRDELIQIRFFCSPQRSNVIIRQSFDGVNFTDVTNSVQFSMGTRQVTLRLQYGFVLTGSCINQILVVDNSPSGDDRITTQASGGNSDFITLIFRPSANQ